MSVTMDLGKVGVLYKGIHDSTQTYERNDIVMSSGSGYIAKQNVPVGVDISNSSYWGTIVVGADTNVFATKTYTASIYATIADVSALQAAVGSPLIANAVADMTDTEKVYVYIGSETGYTSGNWYYYNGSAWVSGGTYNSQGIGDGSITTAKLADGAVTDAKLAQTGGVLENFAELKNELASDLGIDSNVTVDIQDGVFVNASNNAIASSNNFAMTDPIAVKKGQTVVFTAKGYQTSVGMIAICNADNTTRTTVVASIDSDPHTYTYLVKEDGYVVCSYSKASSHKIVLSIDYYKYVNPLNENIVIAGNESLIVGVAVDKAFINATNNQVTSSNNFKISDSIKLYKGQKLSFTGAGTTTTGVICEYDPIADSYTTLVVGTGASTTHEYTATHTMYVRCSYSKNYATSYVVNTPETRFVSFDDVIDTVNALADPLGKIQYPQLFDNILCIGDSLTMGYDGSGGDPLVKNYPHIFEKLAVAETSIKAHGGWNAKQVWDNIISSATDLANYDCAIIYLGTNDGLTDTVATDCNIDYTQNADTNTGCYGKIIGKIKADAPNCRIFCVAGVNDYIRRATAMNPAVRNLSAFYNVGLIDIENCIMSDDGSGTSAERFLYRPNDGIHYNALGYMTMANMMYDAMTDFMSKNRSMYDDYNSN